MKHVKCLIFRKFPIGYIQNFKIETWVASMNFFFLNFNLKLDQHFHLLRQFF